MSVSPSLFFFCFCYGFYITERSSILEALSDHRYFQIESSASSDSSLEAIARTTTTATTMMMKLTFGVVGGQVVAPGHSYRATLESFPRKEMIAATWATHLDAENDAVHFLPDSCRPPSSIPIVEEGAAGTFVFLFSNFQNFIVTGFLTFFAKNIAAGQRRSTR